MLDSPDLRASIIEAIGEGVPITTAFTSLGFNEHLYWDWAHAADHGCWRAGQQIPEANLAIIRDFMAQARVAIAQLESKLVQRIVKAGETVNEKTGQIDWRANAWYLQNGPTRSRWYQHKDADVVIAAARIERQQLNDRSEAELIDLAGGEWREILEPKQLPEPAE